MNGSERSGEKQPRGRALSGRIGQRHIVEKGGESLSIDVSVTAFAIVYIKLVMTDIWGRGEGPANARLGNLSCKCEKPRLWGVNSAFSNHFPVALTASAWGSKERGGWTGNRVRSWDVSIRSHWWLLCAMPAVVAERLQMLWLMGRLASNQRRYYFQCIVFY